MTKATELAQLGGLVDVTGSGTSTKVGIGTTIDISGGLSIKGTPVISNTGVWQGSSAGIQGAQGTTGVQGIQGITGTQGIQGITGTQGATGSQGTQGATGSQGTAGAQGATGTQGTQGTAGPSTTINATDDSSTGTLYPVMVGATGSNQTAKAASTRNFVYNASSANLGIGTVTPGENLHVFSSSGAIKIDSTGDAAVRWAQNGSNKFSLYQSGGTLRFYNNTTSTENVRLDSSGNLLLQNFSTNWGLSGGIAMGDGATTNGSGTKQKFGIFVNGYSTGSGLPQYMGNWYTSGNWGIGPHSATTDATIRIGAVTTDSNGGSWYTGVQNGYANLAINSLYLRANTTTERNALSGISSGSLVYNSTRSSAELWNGTLWVRLHYPGDSVDNYASSVTELVNAGLTGKDYFWMNTTDGGVQETFCDLDTADSSGGKGWMLVASMSDAAEWSRPGYSIRGRLPVYTPWNSEFNNGYETGVTNWWSANWGNRNINYIRFTNTNDIFSHIGPGTWEGSDWYFYWSSAINYKQVWSWGSGTNKNYINDSSGTSDGNANASFHSGWPVPVNNGVTTPRVCMRGFNSAYNIKLSYSVNQRWNNFADSGAGGTTQTWADWWSILTTPTYQYAYETSTSINPNLYSVSGTSDGSVAILPSGSTSTTAGQDCDENNAKCGRDDDSPSASWSNTPTASVGQNTITDYRRSFYIWIK